LTGRHVFIVSALALVLAAQAGWSVATTSGTYDETTYLGFGRATSREDVRRAMATAATRLQ
jgi:hypothetical protein